MVLVRVVVAVPHAAAGAEPQRAVVAVGHSAEGVGLGGEGRHVGSPGGAARVGGQRLLEGERVLRLSAGSDLAVRTLPQVRVRADPRAGCQGSAEGVRVQQGVVFRKASAEPARGEGGEAALSAPEVHGRGVGCLVGDAGTGRQRGLGELPPPTAARGASTRCGQQGAAIR